MAQKQKKQSFMTPEGTSIYPWINRPDVQFDSDGVYKTQLKMSADEAKPLVERIRKVANDELGSKAAKARMPFKSDDETGDIIFTVKSRYAPKVVDASGQILTGTNIPPIMGGATLKLAGNLSPYDVGGNTGVSMQMSAVQVIELAEGTNADGNPFDKVEGGFVAANDNPGGDEEAAQGDHDF